MPDGNANADSERMQVLLRRFEIPLLQFATRITGDRERARDVVQETFVKFQNNGKQRWRADPHRAENAAAKIRANRERLYSIHT